MAQPDRDVPGRNATGRPALSRTARPTRFSVFPQYTGSELSRRWKRSIPWLSFASRERTSPVWTGSFWRFEGISVVDDPALRKEVARRIMESDRSVGAIARIIIEEITRFTGCERACMKFPVDVEHIPELTEWFPDCKIIHITRDPRALAMSKSNDPSGTAIRLIEHPGFAWLTRKAAVCVDDHAIPFERGTARTIQRPGKLPSVSLRRFARQSGAHFAGALRIHRNGVSRGNARAPERPA